MNCELLHAKARRSREDREEKRMAGQSKPIRVIDPFKKRRGEVVLTGYDEQGVVCYQEVLGYEDYYEETGHVFDSSAEVASRGIRRLHFVVWANKAAFQSEAENEYDDKGNLVGGRMRHGPNEPWIEYAK